MQIHLLRQRATRGQLVGMLEALGDYIKLAVDVEKGILAGGGELHADCESVLLDDGCAQVDVWGADWIPAAGVVTFESLINIRPSQGNLTMELRDAELRGKIKEIVHGILEGVDYE